MKVNTAGQLGEAKIEDDDPPPLGKRDVGRFDIAMHAAFFVGGLESLGDLLSYGESFVSRNITLTFAPIGMTCLVLPSLFQRLPLV